MKTKPKDILYCGVRADVIKSAKPKLNEVNLHRFVMYSFKRWSIYYKKDICGNSPPWTNDPILLKYRFTNVCREHDKQTKALIYRVSLNPELSLEDKIVNTFLFRAWNNFETFDFFKLPQPAFKLYKPRAKEIARAKYTDFRKLFPKEFESRKWWSAAYNQGGTKYSWKFPDGEGFKRAPTEAAGAKFSDYEPAIPLRVFHIPLYLKQADICSKLMEAKTQDEAFNIIKTVRGFADFLAYQVFVDLTYIPEFQFSENEFTVAGPGCRRGIDRVFDDKDGMTYEECIFWMRDNWGGILETHPKYKTLWNRLQSKIPNSNVNVMSLENCFCEISKYIKAADNEGRPRQRYIGGN